MDEEIDITKDTVSYVCPVEGCKTRLNVHVQASDIAERTQCREHEQYLVRGVADET